MANKKIIYEGYFTLPAASDSDQKGEETYSVLLEMADPLGSHVCEREAWKRVIEEQYENIEVSSLCIPSQEDASVDKEEFRGFSFALYLKRGKTETETIFHVRPRILHAGNNVRY